MHKTSELITLSIVAGTKGYEKVVEAFTEASFNLDFEEISSDFLQFLPQAPARVLDAGSGVGQNSAALAKLGHSVVSVEPLNEFLQIAKSKYQGLDITWINDSLPRLNKVDVCAGLFDFVLIDGVWHHLSIEERRHCIRRLAEIVNIEGICAISLRNGPAGAGTHVFSTCNDELATYANEYGFQIVLLLENQSSKMQNKPNVIWSRVALKKVGS
ncbi:class I SAM-dependent methyltransferase [Arenicella xantha]|uniref:Methyltransferase family protein n=1 Tax=Arenicella xantha TaxID=644221 RepID=A0A395JTM4_9GAMM|nr:class I SAM-dependent methyltransferase [Arenicella xantha]RBP53682.1 methyltransferase family protein [Arenicella xantha]